MKLSLVIPCFNEEENIREIYRSVADCFQSRLFSYECVFVDDGSTDGTFRELKKLVEEKSGHIQVVSFSRNFGKEAAIYAGLRHAKGERVCIIDADLQQPPETVLQMMEILDAQPEVDCVAAYQKNRKESKLLSGIKSCFYKLINKLSDVEFVNKASDFRMMRRKMVDAVLSMTEYHRFSKGILSWVGFETRFIPYEVRRRKHGKSKWSNWGLTKYAMEGIISFSTAPLKIATVTGFLSAIAAVLYSVSVLMEKLIFGIAVPGYATIVILLLLLGGLILFSLGIIGEYLARMYIQMKNRPIYIEKTYLESGRKEENL